MKVALARPRPLGEPIALLLASAMVNPAHLMEVPEPAEKIHADLQRRPVSTLDICVDCRQTRAVDGEQTWRSKERSRRDKLSQTKLPALICVLERTAEHNAVCNHFFFNPHLSALMF